MAPVETAPSLAPSAWRTVLLGFVSSTLIMVASAMRGWPFANLTAEPWFFQLTSSNDLVRWSFLVGFYLGFAGLCRAWVRALQMAKRLQLSTRMIVVMFALWSFPLAASVPLFSGDVYVYYVDGQALNRGFSVYESGVAALGPEPIVHMVHPIWRDTKTMYGPLFMKLAEVVARCTDGHLLAGVAVFRAIAVASLALMAWAIGVLCKKLQLSVAAGLAFALLNPITLLHLVSGAHNDAAMIGLFMAGLAVGVKTNRWSLRLLALALCAAGAAFKVPAFAGVLLLGWIWAGETRAGIVRRMVGAALAGAVGLVLLHVYGTVTGLGWGWLKATDVPGLAHPILAPANAFAFATGGPFGVPYGVNAVSRVVALLASLMLCVWLVLRTGKSATAARVLRAAGWAMLVLAWLGPAVYPWYLVWGVVLSGALGAERFEKFLVIMTTLACLAVAPGGYGLLDTWNDWRRTITALLWLAVFGYGARYLIKRRKEAGRIASPTAMQQA